MTAETKVGVTGDQHFGVNGSVRIMAGHAAFLHRGVFIDERTLLLGVTLGACRVHAFQIDAGASNGVAGVRLVTITTAHFAIHDLVTVGQRKLRPFIKVTLETGLR